MSTPAPGASPYTFDTGYDANGNRDTGGTTVGVANELSTDGTWNYTYDNDGNLTEKTSVSTSASWTYAYNASDELTAVQEYNTSGSLVETIDYKYDGFGEEIEQDVTPAGGSLTATKFAYNGWNSNMPAGTGNANFQQIAILNGDNSLQTRNIDGNMPGQNLARIDESSAPDGGGVYFLLNDRQNSVRDVVDASGNVKDAISYTAFGTIASETDVTYRGWYAWTGMETDQQTGLQYNNARWYNAATGTWMSQDPLGFDAGDSNLYRYVNNAPTNATDPSGEDIYYCVSPTGAAGAGHGGLLIGPVSGGISWKGRQYDEKTKKVEDVQYAGPLVPGGIAGKYIYLSVDLDQTIFKDGSWTKFLPGQGGVPIKLDVQVYDSFDAFFKSKEGKRYSYFVKYPTTQKENDDVLKKLTKKWDNAGYRLLWKNCSNLAMDALIDAGAIKGANVNPAPNARGALLKVDTISGGSFTYYWRNQNDQLEEIKSGSKSFALFKAHILDIGDHINNDIKKVAEAIEAAGKQVNTEITEFFKKLVK